MFGFQTQAVCSVINNVRLYTVNVRNPNVRLSDNAEIRTIDRSVRILDVRAVRFIRTFEHSASYTIDAEIRTFGYITFGFRTEQNVWNPNKFVRISDIFHTEQELEPNRIELSEIRTVRISDVDCIYIYNVWKPDITSGFQTFGQLTLSEIRKFVYKPDVR